MEPRLYADILNIKPGRRHATGCESVSDRPTCSRLCCHVESEKHARLANRQTNRRSKAGWLSWKWKSPALSNESKSHRQIVEAKSRRKGRVVPLRHSSSVADR